jgi:ATP-dependent helicase/nuclease subunit B
MSRVIVIPEEEDMIERVYGLLTDATGGESNSFGGESNSSTPDLSQNIIVFPGKRPGHYLRKLIGNRLGTSFIPPVVYSMDEFINFLVSDGSLRNAEAIDAIHILYELSLNSKALHPEFRKFDNFYPFGLRLFDILEELYIEGVSYERLRFIETLIPVPAKSSENIRFLSDLYRDFYEELPRRGLSTRGLRYSMAGKMDRSELIKKLGRLKRLIIAGFFVFTEQERRLIKNLLEERSVAKETFPGGEVTVEAVTSTTNLPEVILLFHNGEGIKDTIKALGIKDVENNFFSLQPSAFSLQPKFNLISAPDTHGMVKAVGTLLKDFSQIDERTVIVLPKAETLFPLLRQGIPYLDKDSYNISMGYPVQRTPIYGFFMSLFDAVNSIDNGHIYMPRYLRFVLHPYVKNIYFRRSAEENRKIFHAIEEALRREKIPTFVSLEELEGDISSEIFRDDKECKEKSEQLRYIHDNTIRRFLNFKNIGHFMEECRRVLLFLYNHSTARLHPFFYPYVEAFIKELDKVSLSGLKDMTFEHRESYFNLFKKLTASPTVPFEGTPLRGLQILGVLETRNIKFKRVLFLDLNEGVFPDTKEDYLLPYHVRKDLGLPTYQDRERLAYYYFNVLLNSAEEVYLFYINNDNTERSRFIERLLWEIEKSNSKILEKSVNYKVRLSTPLPEPIHKTVEVMNVISNIKLTPSAMDEYLVCGIRFYYSQILRLKKDKDLTGDPDRSEIGNIVHSALREYFTHRRGIPLRREYCSTQEMEKIVDNIFKERYRNISGSIYLLRYQIKKRLKEVVEYMPELFSDFKGFSIHSVEEPISVSLFNTLFECRIDAIGRTQNKEIIIDYKTSGKKEYLEINFNKLDPQDRTTWFKRIKSLQMPLYMLIYGRAKALNMEALEGYYLLIGKHRMDKETLLQPFKGREKIEALDILSKIIQSLIDEIKDPDKPFAPPDDFDDACNRCDYVPFCGTEWALRNKHSRG